MNTKLLKVANHIREKRAGVGGDFARAFTADVAVPTASSLVNPQLTRITSPLTSLADVLGVLHGTFGRTPSLEQIQEMDANADKSFIPGVGYSRIGRRRKALRKLLRDKPELLNLPVSEVTGAISSTLLPAYAGAAMNGLHSGGNVDDVQLGSAYGLLAGVGSAGIGSLLAALTKRRSLENQAKIENSPGRAILRHIVPGLAAYDFWKGIGATRNLSGNIDDIKAQLQAVKDKRKGVNDYEA